MVILPKHDARFIAIIFAVVLGLAFFRFWPNSEILHEFNVVPDSGEYYYVARELVEHSSFQFQVATQTFFPSRYDPVMSLLLVPFLVLGNNSPVAAGWFVSLCAVAVSVLPLLIFGRGGIAASLLLLILPLFLATSSMVLTDVPALLGLFLAIYTLEKRSLPAGILAIILMSTRLIYAPFIALFLIALAMRKQWIPLLLGLGELVASALYRTIYFQSPFRSGYHAWLPIPHENIFAVFNAQFFIRNVALYQQSLFLFVLLAAFLFARGGVKTWVYYLSFAGIAYGLAILFYFFADQRFALPLQGAAVLLFTEIMLPVMQKPFRVWAALSLVAIFAFYAPQPIMGRSNRYAAVQSLKELSREATVIGSIEPSYLVYLSQFVGTYLPIDRRVEYASKLYAARPLSCQISTTESLDDNRQRLLACGAIDTIAQVAFLEDGELTLTSDHELYLLNYGLKSERLASIDQKFTRRPVNQFVEQLIFKR